MAFGSVNVPGDLPTKQDKLTGLPGQVVGFDGAGAALAVQGWSNRNLLDDWYFLDSINQRGQEEYAATGYTIDRWATFSSHPVTILDDAIRVRAPLGLNSQIQGFYQPLEEALPDGTTFTLSLLYRAVVSGSRINLRARDINGTLLASVTIPNTNGAVNLVSVTGVGSVKTVFAANFTLYEPDAYIDAIAAKLELGPVQTLAHKEGDTWVLNDPPPNKALELAKCQKYQINLIPSGVLDFVFLGVGTAFSSTVARIFCPLPVSMRAKPTIKIEGAFRLSTNAGWSVGIDVTSITVLGYQAHGVELTVEVAEGLTSGQTYQLCGDSTASKFLLDSNI